MSRANPLWGAPRVHGELAKLGISISQAAVSKYMVRHRTPPSHTWRSFLDNHVNDLVSLDFFTLPTATFRVPGIDRSSFRRRTVPVMVRASGQNHDITSFSPCSER